MERSAYDAVVLGAGPGGLTAAYCLAREGAQVLVVERGSQVGGLMRGIQRGAFRVDLGRKDLHAHRFADVHALWTGLLGADYVPCPRRVGILYDGRILEKDSGPKGRLRGMSPGHALKVAAGALWSQVKPGPRVVQSEADYYILRSGKPYYETFVAGYQAKFDGERPPHGPKEMPRFAAVRERLARGRMPVKGGSGGSHHPALGTQQIVDALYRGAQENGVQFVFEAEAAALHAEGGSVSAVVVREGARERTVATRRVIAGLPAPMILGLLRPGAPEALRNPPRGEKALKRSTALVYLFADGEPRFPHSWLEVTDPALKMGRVTNYSFWGGRMVPRGKTALCIEFFALEGDRMMQLSKPALLELAVSEASSNGLIDRARLYDSLVLQMPLANATTHFTEWRTAWMQEARGYLRSVRGLYETNRPGMDRACLAGIDAAHACISGRPMSERSLRDTEAPAPQQAPVPPVRRYAFGS